MIKPSTHPGRVLAALFIAPLIGCVLGLWFIFLMSGDSMSAQTLSEIFTASAWVWLYSLPLSVILGALVHFTLVKLRLWPVTAYTLVGLLLGPLALMVWLALMGVGVGQMDMDAQGAWLGAITGGTTALIFRMLVHKTSDSPSSPPAGTRPY